MNFAVEENLLPLVFRNEVIRWSDVYYRVIEIDTSDVFLFELNTKKGVPQRHCRSHIEELMYDDEICIIEEHDFDALPLSVNSRGASAIREARQSYEVISPIVKTPEYLISSVRGALVEKQVSLHNIARSTIYRLLRLYWSHGQSLDALTKNYQNCGAPGQTRSLTKKTGPKSETRLHAYAIRTDALVQLMERIISSVYFKKKTTVAHAHRRFISLCKNTFPGLAPSQIPPVSSLRNLIEKRWSYEYKQRQRTDPRVFEKDIRTLQGTATAGVFGPGDRYELDATVFDVHLVDAKDRTRVIGRPILYILVDVFSRMIVGYYLGFFSPSYFTAMLALLNAVENKDYLLKKYSVTEELCSTWPGVGLPDVILCDKAELYKLHGSNLVESTGIRIENTASGRSDAKGIVEKQFDIIQDPFKPIGDGKSTKETRKKAGAIDGRHNATLTIEEVEDIVVGEILWRNHDRALANYDCQPEMPIDMPLTPHNIWQWGIKNRTGRQQRVDIEKLKIAVLPRDKATVSEDGIKFRKLLYSARYFEELGWFLRNVNNRSRPKSVDILYHPLSTDSIYVVVPNKVSMPVLCQLKTRSIAYAGLSFVEASARLKIRGQVNAQQNLHANEQKRLLEEKSLKITANARREKKQLPKKPKNQTVREIKDNRYLAKETERQKRLTKFPEHDKVLNTTNDAEEMDDFSNPSLNDLYEIDKDVDNATTRIDYEQPNPK